MQQPGSADLAAPGVPAGRATEVGVAAAEAADPVGGPRVVIVEDDPTVRVAVERYLGAKYGISVA